MEFFGKLLYKKKNRTTSYDVSSLTRNEHENLKKSESNLPKKYKKNENEPEVIRKFSNFFKGCKQNENDGKTAKKYDDIQLGKNDSLKNECLIEEESLLVDFEVPEAFDENEKPVIDVVAEVYNEPKDIDQEVDEPSKVGLLVEKYENLFVPAHQKPFKDIPNVYYGKRY